MMVCERCGRDLEPEDRFCSACGAPAPKFSGEPTGTVAMDPHDTGPIPVAPLPDRLLPGNSVLVVERGPEVGHTFELTGERLTVGRSADSDIMLDDVTVSRHHAEFVQGSAGWVLVDLRSLNGTYVNRAYVDRHDLSSGDLIQIGKYRVRYLQSQPEA